MKKTVHENGIRIESWNPEKPSRVVQRFLERRPLMRMQRNGACGAARNPRTRGSRHS
jgi:hypothetical protein